MAKFNFRGKELNELVKMSDNDFLKLLNSRQRRTINRGIFKINAKLMKKIDEAAKQVAQEKPQKNIRTHSRSLVIMPKMIGLTIHVHNGKEFVKVVIKDRMIGHYLGEYALTRKMVKHSSPGVGASRSSKFVPVK